MLVPRQTFQENDAARSSDDFDRIDLPRKDIKKAARRRRRRDPCQVPPGCQQSSGGAARNRGSGGRRTGSDRISCSTASTIRAFKAAQPRHEPEVQEARLGNLGHQSRWSGCACAATEKHSRESRHFQPRLRNDRRSCQKWHRDIVSHGNQTGEGWFSDRGDVGADPHRNAGNIVCTQPFACLPNHVVGKGVIKELRQPLSCVPISSPSITIRVPAR